MPKVGCEELILSSSFSTAFSHFQFARNPFETPSTLENGYIQISAFTATSPMFWAVFFTGKSCLFCKASRGVGAGPLLLRTSFLASGLGWLDWSVHTGPCPVQSSNESPPKIRKNSHLGCSVDGSGHQPLDTTWALHYCICFTLGPFYASKSHYNVRRPMIERKWLYKGASIISTGSSCK